MNLKTLACSYPGAGKSYFALTHPKSAWLITEPGSEILVETHPHLAKNLVWKEEFIPSPVEDVKAVFERLDKAIVKAHTEAKDGLVETLILDNLSFLMEYRWQYINKYERQVSSNGSLDTRSMYGTLGRWGFQFIINSILSFKGNVVVTCHEQVEGEEAMANKVAKSTPIVPSILGGLRDKLEGMFSAAIYLDKQKTAQGYKYVARCQKGGQRNAKNRFGLPELVEDVSYSKIIDTINNNKAKA